MYSLKVAAILTSVLGLGMCLPHIERRAESRRAESRQLPPKCQTIGVQGVGGRVALQHLGCVCGGEYSPDNTTCRYAWNDSDEDTEEFYGQCFKGICIPSRCQPRNFFLDGTNPIGCEVECESGIPTKVLYYPSGKPCLKRHIDPKTMKTQFYTEGVCQEKRQKSVCVVF